MENASKALIMAASVLLGVMIITVGVALFRSFGGTSAEIMGEIEKAKIEEFNNQFLKYYGLEDGISVHDVVTIANLAKENNEYMEVSDQVGYSQKSLYIQVDLNKETNIEKKSESKLIEMMQDVKLKYDNSSGQLINPYKIEQVLINSNTHKVMYIKIVNK